MADHQGGPRAPLDWPEDLDGQNIEELIAQSPERLAKMPKKRKWMQRLLAEVANLAVMTEYTHSASVVVYNTILVKYYTEYGKTKTETPFSFSNDDDGQMVFAAVPGITGELVPICDVCNAVAYLIFSGYMCRPQTRPTELGDFVRIIGCVGIFLIRFCESLDLAPPSVVTIMWAATNTLRVRDPESLASSFVAAVGSTLGGPPIMSAQAEVARSFYCEQLGRALGRPEAIMEIKSLFKKNTGNCGETIPFVHMMDRIESETLTNLRSLAIHLPLLKKYLRENPNAEVITTATIHECFIAACGSCKAISDEANFAAEEYRLRIPTSRHGYGGYFSSYGSMKYDREVI